LYVGGRLWLVILAATKLELYQYTQFLDLFTEPHEALPARNIWANFLPSECKDYTQNPFFPVTQLRGSWVASVAAPGYTVSPC